MELASKEWIETDGRGGFAMGSADLVMRRRYHSLLISATEPPTGRVALFNAVDVYLEAPGVRHGLSSHSYAPDVVFPYGRDNVKSFTPEPWPTWHFEFDGQWLISQEWFMRRGVPAIFMRWKLLEGPSRDAILKIRPLISGRDYHLLLRQDPSLDHYSHTFDWGVRWKTFPHMPDLYAFSNGGFKPESEWYYNFRYEEEEARGHDFVEDLMAPGEFSFDLSLTPAIMIASEGDIAQCHGPDAVARFFGDSENVERNRRKKFPSRLHRAVDNYLVEGGGRKSIVAGYPWFTDWGRDTFIALRGLCLSTERYNEAEEILVSWADTISEGMIPNRFPDQGETLDYNSVDASLWYVIAMYEYITRYESRSSKKVSSDARSKMLEAIEAIIVGYSNGTRYNIKLDDDGLLRCGDSQGNQLTWMDARYDGIAVTPRIGKPVEVQALWLNALFAGHALLGKWKKDLDRGVKALANVFWNDDAHCLFDVVDVDHQPGAKDPSVRPNQILCVGGLPLAVIKGKRAKEIVDTVEQLLVTPYGLRSLAPGSDNYHPEYLGSPEERDNAYHQGTVWMWPIGPFVEAWLKTRRNTRKAQAEARERFLEPILAHLDQAGLGHCSEIFDAESPYTPRGCPAQAWSVGEALRIQLDLLNQ